MLKLAITRRLLPAVLEHVGHTAGFLTLVAAAAGIWGAHGVCCRPSRTSVYLANPKPCREVGHCSDCILRESEHGAVFRRAGPFMSWPASFLSGPAAATGFAVINSCGSIGGFVGELRGGRDGLASTEALPQS